MKPVAAKDLFIALHNTAEQIEEHKRNSISFEDASDGQIVKNALLSSLLERICRGELTANEALKRADELGIELLAKRYVVLICRYENRGESANRQVIASKVKFILGEDSDTLYFFNGVENIVLLIKGDTDIAVTEMAYHKAQTLKHEIDDGGDNVLTVSISGVVNRIVGIQDAYHEAGILMKTIRAGEHRKDILCGDIGPIDHSMTEIDDSFHVNIENKLKFAVKKTCPPSWRS